MIGDTFHVITLPGVVTDGIGRFSCRLWHVLFMAAVSYKLLSCYQSAHVDTNYFVL